ncbi:unnamed protein product [Mytilus coruscus]|uniref:Uncharacterized protein n=1 Tax=Mytilus coruscus TaxID=42192 RepID=A0A6J8DM15_MYTCO|nr:unnamed protein product [Mytilus coruscus]
MDKIAFSETRPSETEHPDIGKAFKRKHSDSLDDNENPKKQKVNLENEKAKENIEVKSEESLESNNEVSTENKGDNVIATYSKSNESNIVHLQDHDAFCFVKENKLKPNSIITEVENAEQSKDLDGHLISKNDDKHFDQNEIICETVQESDTISQTTDASPTTEIDTIDSSSSEVPDPEPIKREEAKKFPKLYRLLRDGECKENGLQAKDPGSNTSVADHVANGSNGSCSKYISTCSTRSAAYNWLRLKTKSRRYRNGIKTIVEIDVNNLPSNVNIIDLTSEELRKQYEEWDKEINRQFHRFAASHGEVLLVGFVPADCLADA